jgi:LacI family transcriptional regulator
MERIAARLGVSKNAVSLALRGMPGLGDELRGTILETAAAMGYRYRAADRPAQAAGICVAVSQKVERGGEFFDEVLAGIESAAREAGAMCTIVWYSEHEDGSEPPLPIANGTAAGILCVGIFSREQLEALSGHGQPLVLVDHYIDGLALNSVLSDNVGGACRLVSGLLRAVPGDIGYLGDMAYSPSFFDRWLGYVKAHRSMGRAWREEYILKDAGEAAGLGRLPSVFFCCNDAYAIALMKELNRLGKSVPGDVAVAGFDDSVFATSVHPELTTVRIDKMLMGRKAVRRLLQLIGSPGQAPETLLLKPELVARGSAPLVV